MNVFSPGRCAAGLLLLCLALPARAQSLTFERVQIPGMPGAISIAQDSDGYMWFGTRVGLARYDGYQFTIYKHDPQDSTSLGANWVEALLVDREGTLWLGTYGGGLNRFDSDTGTFTRYRHDPQNPYSLSQDSVTVLLVDRGGAFWVGTRSGLNRLDTKTGRFTRYLHDPRDPASLSDNAIRALYEDREGTLWIGTNDPFDDEKPAGAGGLNRLDRSTGRFTRYLANPEDEHSLIDKHVEDILEDARGTLWVSTWGDGLHSLNRKTGRFTRYPYDPDEPERLSRPHVKRYPGIGGVSFVFEDSAGILWIGAFGGGLNRYDPKKGRLQHFEASSDQSGLDDDAIWTMYESRDGVLWVGTGNTQYKLDPYRSRYDREQTSINGIWTLYEDASGILWLGTVEDGLFRYDRTTGQVKQYRHDPADPGSLSGDTIGAIFEDRQGNLWIGTGGNGLNRFDRDAGRFIRYPFERKYASGMSESGVWSILVDRGGSVWLGTDQGLDRMDPSTGVFTHYLHDPADPATLIFGSVGVVYEDRTGAIWAASETEGVSRMDPVTGRFTRYYSTHRNSRGAGIGRVLSIGQDREGVVWLGAEGSGLNRYDPQTDSFTQFTPWNSDLPDDTILGLWGDEDGTLWLVTPGGLTQFDPVQQTFQTFAEERGVAPELFTGFPSRGRRGDVFIGTRSGFYALPTEGIVRNPHAPEVVLTGVRPFGTTGEESETALRRGLAEGHVRLAHDQNSLSFDFLALHYSQPEKNRYAYRLEGHDEDWRQAGAERTATYSRLPPGNYVFRVRAASADGVWTEEGASLRVAIRPPWWRTRWAYALFGLLFAAGVFAVDRVQRRRLLSREREKSSLREKELRAEAAEAWANYLQSENDRKGQELEQARTLQLSLLPERLPDHPYVEIAAHTQPATEVGGDYYDFDVAEDGTLTFAIGDATGHGLQAGTMVTAAKSLFTHSRAQDDLVEVVRQASRTLKRMRLPKLYMAMAMGRLRGRTLEIVGAGMPPAVLYRAASGCIEEIALKGMPLGSFTEYPYERRCLELAEGDTLVLMSDGFPELFNAEGAMLGYESVGSLVREVGGRPPRDVIDHLTRRAAAWMDGRPQTDDVTFLVMRARPAGAERQAGARS